MSPMWTRRCKPGAPVLHEGRADGSRARRPVAERRQHVANSATAMSRPASPRPTWSSSARFKTEATHQGYIEPHACLAQMGAGRPGRSVVLHPGPLHGARHLCARSWAWSRASCASPRRKSAAALAARPRSSSNRVALALSRKAGPPGQDGDVARGSVPRHRADRLQLDRCAASA